MSALPLWTTSCCFDGWLATVGVEGGQPDSGLEGGASPGPYVLVTPSVEPLSETSARVTWPAVPGDVAYYEVRVSTSGGAFTADASAGRLPKGSTTAVLTDLAPGTLGKVVVAAAAPGIDGGVEAPSALLWTPFGAINEDSVNSVTPLAGYAGPPYAEGMFVSSGFSMFFSHAFLKVASFVFAGMPASPTARPVYNFASPVVAYPNGFAYPDVTDVSQIWSDGVSRVLLANFHQNRVVLYNHLPLEPGVAAPDLILGQTTWSGTAPNGGAASANASGLQDAAGACFNGTTLYVRDNGNNRVLGWNEWPTQMGQPADFVLGQPDMKSSAPNNGGVSKDSFSFVALGGNIDCRGGRLAVPDPGNRRVLLWNTAPTANVPADVVLGQSSGALSGSAGAGGLGSGGLIEPVGVAMLDGGGGLTAIAVADFAANRVVAWNSVPTSDGAPFDRVYGQPDRTTTTANTGGLSMGSLSQPGALTVDDQNRLWVADFGNARALQFDLDNPVAIGLFGQRNGTSTELMPGSYSRTRTAWAQFEKGLFSLDPSSGMFATSFARGMFWSSAPLDGNTPATTIQGQPDDTSAVSVATSATSESAVGTASAVAVGGRVYWSDTARILSMAGTFTGDNAVPDVVLGDQDFQGNTVAPTTLEYAIHPTGLATDGRALLAVDGARIVGWKAAPAASNVPIDFALGQPDLLHDGANNGGVSASTLGGGSNAMTIAGGKLVVADASNHRVLVWNAVPTSTGVPADVVLGQPDFTSNGAGSGMAQMNAPGGVAVLDGRLIVSDVGNERLLVFDGVPTVSGAAAARTWDPRTASFSLPSWFSTEELAPHAIGAYGGRLYVGQTGRVLVLPDIFSDL